MFAHHFGIPKALPWIRLRPLSLEREQRRSWPLGKAHIVAILSPPKWGLSPDTGVGYSAYPNEILLHYIKLLAMSNSLLLKKIVCSWTLIWRLLKIITEGSLTINYDPENGVKLIIGNTLIRVSLHFRDSDIVL